MYFCLLNVHRKSFFEQDNQFSYCIVVCNTYVLLVCDQTFIYSIYLIVFRSCRLIDGPTDNPQLSSCLCTYVYVDLRQLYITPGCLQLSCAHVSAMPIGSVRSFGVGRVGGVGGVVSGERVCVPACNRLCCLCAIHSLKAITFT